MYSFLMSSTRKVFLMKHMAKGVRERAFKDKNLHKERHEQLNHPNNLAWAIKLSLHFGDQWVSLHIIDPEFKKSHSANILL